MDGPHLADGVINAVETVNILIVDDEPKNLVVLETVLSNPAYRLVRAESADQALLALLADEFALLILDIRMPGTTGIELAEIIKERKKTARVPIIFLTAYYNEDQHVLEGYEAGAIDYMQKPVNAAVLRSKVAIFAELHRTQREISNANRALQAEVDMRRQAEQQLRELNDTLELRVAERTQSIKFLMKEVNHRSKNLLSVVQAIAKQTASGNAEDFIMRFSNRVRALAVSHDLLVKHSWQSIEIAQLIEAQLSPFADLLGTRISLSGPPLRLSVAAAQTLGMVAHELATNAAKHGALSDEKGIVDITWDVDSHTPGGDCFKIDWIEQSGPPASAPTRRGFGTKVVKDMVEISFDGDVVIDYPSAGFLWRLSCPLVRITDADAEHRESSAGSQNYRDRRADDDPRSFG